MNRMSGTNNKNRHIFTSKANIIYIIMFVLLTFIDQFSKQLASEFLRDGSIELIPGVLELRYLENKGAAWGILQNQTWLLIVVTFIVLGIVVYFFCRLPDGRKFLLLRVCLVMLISGAFGNFLDRITNHYVIDFIYFSLINFPIFNFADCLVCISAAILLFCLMFKYKESDFSRHNENEY